MKHNLILAIAAVLAACSTVPEPTQRQLLCGGPVNNIPDDDPGLALFADSDETLADRKVRLAIERVNSCEENER